MMEKVKAFWGSVKDVVIYILSPIAALVIYILYLKGENHKLQDQVESAHFDTKEEELKNEEKQADQAGSDAVHHYEQLLEQYQHISGGSELSGSPDGVRGSSQGSAEADRDSGPKNKG